MFSYPKEFLTISQISGGDFIASAVEEIKKRFPGAESWKAEIWFADGEPLTIFRANGFSFIPREDLTGAEAEYRYRIRGRGLEVHELTKDMANAYIYCRL